MTTLVTDRLTLRPMQGSDVAPLHAILRDAETMRYWSTPPHPDLATTQAWVASGLDRRPLTDFVIELSGEVVGKAGAWRLPEIGFILARSHWRQGIIREAMGAIIPHLFDTYDLPCLTADVDPRNMASLALLAGLGFVETHRAQATFCIDGVWVDSVYLALPRPRG